jgi:hypothetical protein
MACLPTGYCGATNDDKLTFDGHFLAEGVKCEDGKKVDPELEKQ